MVCSNVQVFAAELAGTFLLVVLATGTIVYDAQMGGRYGVWLAAAGPFVALVIGVYSFGKVSMAHFNPAVTVGYYITGHITGRQVPWYVAAEIIGAMLGSLFVLAVLGGDANLGANEPNHGHSLLLVFPAEALASALLMAVILAVVCAKVPRVVGGVAIGGIVAADILAFSSISGASMNPARALAPALVSGALADLWLYWTATFAGTAAAATILRGRFKRPAA